MGKKENEKPIVSGDKVEIIGLGWQRANRTGEIADGRSWVRTVGQVFEDDVYELYNERTGVITGYYPRNSVKKIKEEEE